MADVTDDDSLFPFNFEEKGRHLLPFFSSEERARQFARADGHRDDEVFQPFRLLAGFVASPPNDVFDLVFDPKSPSERRITREERRLLRALSIADQREHAG